MTLRQLRVFVAIVRGGSLAEAAASLHLTRPAVSLALAELEKQCGRRVFDRHRQRLHLNENGFRLLPMADELLARADHIEHALGSAEDAGGRLRVGASHTVGHHLLPPLLRDFRQRRGATTVDVSIANTRAVCAALEAFELDLGMVEGHVDTRSLQCVPWRGDRMLVIAAPGHPLALAREALEVAGLEAQDWLLREPGSGTREQFMLQIAAHLRHWHVAYEFSAAAAIVSAVSAGLGLACISELEVADALACGRVVALPMRAPITRELSLVMHPRRFRGEAARAFIDTCMRAREAPV